MQESISSQEYEAFLHIAREARKGTGITQGELAARLCGCSAITTQVLLNGNVRTMGTITLINKH